MRIERVVVQSNASLFDHQVKTRAVLKRPAIVGRAVWRSCTLPVIAGANETSRLFPRDQLLAIGVRVVIEDATFYLTMHERR